MICKQYDLIAIQEVQDNLEGLQKLMDELGPDFGMTVSDKTGAYPGKGSTGERLAFIFRWAVVQRCEVVSDISYDRTEMLERLHDNMEPITDALSTYHSKLDDYNNGIRKSKPFLKMPAFLTFIRTPYIVSFKIVGKLGTTPYKFMAVNAHLFFGHYIDDRRQEFNALLEWLIARVKENDRAYYPNFILLGDLNLDFDNPENDYDRIEKYMKAFNNNAGDKVNVNFPLITVHKGDTEVIRTNARGTQTFDQIGLFFRDSGLPTYDLNATMDDTINPRGPDYGIFNFRNLFSNALKKKDFSKLTSSEQIEFVKRFHFEVSDHMPLWLRLPLPDE
jgi:endonuclease/exonuclease/phosphatase family metal-dependent hydrolase